VAAGSAVRRTGACARQGANSATCGARSAARRGIGAGRLTCGVSVGDTQWVTGAIARIWRGGMVLRFDYPLHACLGEAMFRFRSSKLLSLAIAILSAALLPGSSVSQSGNGAARGQDSRRFELKHYFAVTNPIEAASQMRSDAIAAGLDMQEHPVRRIGGSKSSGPDSVTIKHADRWTAVFVGDDRFKEKLVSLGAAASSDSIVSVFVYAEPSFSLEEVASILESGIRVLEMRGSNLIIAAGEENRLAALARMPFCKWMGEFSLAMKISSRVTESPDGRYLIESFTAPRPEFLEDLRRLNVEIIHASTRSPLTSVRGAFRDVLVAAELWWVTGVYLPATEAPNAVEQPASHAAQKALDPEGTAFGAD
jgi:hypothetical protein